MNSEVKQAGAERTIGQLSEAEVSWLCRIGAGGVGIKYVCDHMTQRETRLVDRLSDSGFVRWQDSHLSLTEHGAAAVRYWNAITITKGPIYAAPLEASEPVGDCFPHMELAECCGDGCVVGDDCSVNDDLLDLSNYVTDTLHRAIGEGLNAVVLQGRTKAGRRWQVDFSIHD